MLSIRNTATNTNMNITYQNKSLSQDSNRTLPTLFEKDPSYPYHQLGPIEFEELVYFTIKQTISDKSIWINFNEVVLLGGVKDSGFDCQLKKMGAVTGLIQCKHSSKNRACDVGIVAREIIKTILYSIVEPSLIPDINQFTYYFLASAGLSKQAKMLLENFNEIILQSKKLEKWVNTIISSYSSISTLKDYQNIKGKLHPLLSSLSVKNMNIKDIDILLAEAFNSNIVTNYFNVRKVVVPNESLAKLTPEQAIMHINRASEATNDLPNYFGNKITTHIERNETQQLYNWIFKDLSSTKKNIAVLDANAGLGKTTVLRDLYVKLYHNGTPSLFLKADKYYASDIMELERKVFQAKDVELESICDAISEEHEKIVVIIDQLDALSQTLSTNRDFLLTYNRLIGNLSHRRNVRIVVSIRSFDLKYDSELNVYNSSKYEKVRLNKLPIDDVSKVLTEMSISKAPDRLKELLRTPNHLNIFCKLTHNKTDNLDSLYSLKDLYDKLWIDKVIRKNNELAKTNKIVLNLIIDKMSECQEMLIYNSFVDEFNNELTFLESEGLITIEQNKIQLFHQTFYDFLFAKQFVENGKALINYVKERGQSLYDRQIVKMVIQYLRESDKSEYTNTISALIESNDIRFHIKMLVTTTLGIVQMPYDNEKKLVKDLILKKPELRLVFLESVVSEEWLKFLIEINLPLNYLSGSGDKSNAENQQRNDNLIIRLLRNNIGKDSMYIIDFLMVLADNPAYREIVKAILYFYEYWEDDRLYVLFEKYYIYKAEDTNDNFRYFKILEDISKYKPEYVMQLLKPLLIRKFETDSAYFPSVTLDYPFENLIKKLYKAYPKLAFNFIWQIMSEVSQKYQALKEDTELFTSHYYCDGDIKSTHSMNADDFMIKRMKMYIEDYMTIEEARNVIRKISKSTLIPELMFKALILNKFRDELLDDTFEFIDYIGSHKGYNGTDKSFSYEMRKLIANSFKCFTHEKKSIIVGHILSIKHVGGRSYRDTDGEIKRFRPYYKKEYLFIRIIDESQRRLFPKLQRRYNELYRLYGDVDSGPNDISRITIGGVPPPVSEENCNSMSIRDWVKTMKKYNSTYIPSFHNDNGGMNQHTLAFQKEVARRPQRYLDTLYTLLDDTDVDLRYVVSGLEGFVENNFDPNATLALYKSLSKKVNSDGSLFSLLRVTDYLNKNEVIDNEVLIWLSSLVENYEDIDNNLEDLLMKSINKIRGIALQCIMRSSKHRIDDNIVMETVKRAVSFDIDYLNTTVLSNIAFLNTIDENVAFGIYEELVSRVDSTVLKHSINHSRFYLDKFHLRMHSYFDRLLQLDDLAEQGAIMIVQCWIRDLDYSNSLIKKLNKDETYVFSAMIKVAEGYYLKEGKVYKKSLILLTELLDINNSELSQMLSAVILRNFEPTQFIELYDFLKGYVKSEHPVNDPSYYFAFLLKSSTLYPKECLELLEHTIPYERPSIQHSSYYDKEPIQIILAIYSALTKGSIKDEKIIERTLTVFDKMLQIEHLRTNAVDALDVLNTESQLN